MTLMAKSNGNSNGDVKDDDDDDNNNNNNINNVSVITITIPLLVSHLLFATPFILTKMLPCHDSLSIRTNIQKNFLDFRFKPHVQHAVSLV